MPNNKKGHGDTETKKRGQLLIEPKKSFGAGIETQETRETTVAL